MRLFTATCVSEQTRIRAFGSLLSCSRHISAMTWVFPVPGGPCIRVSGLSPIAWATAFFCESFKGKQGVPSLDCCSEETRCVIKAMSTAGLSTAPYLTRSIVLSSLWSLTRSPLSTASSKHSWRNARQLARCLAQRDASNSLTSFALDQDEIKALGVAVEVDTGNKVPDKRQLERAFLI